MRCYPFFLPPKNSKFVFILCSPLCVGNSTLFSFFIPDDFKNFTLIKVISGFISLKASLKALIEPVNSWPRSTVVLEFSSEKLTKFLFLFLNDFKDDFHHPIYVNKNMESQYNQLIETIFQEYQ